MTALAGVAVLLGTLVVPAMGSAQVAPPAAGLDTRSPDSAIAGRIAQNTGMGLPGLGSLRGSAAPGRVAAATLPWLPKGFTTFRDDPRVRGQVLRDRCGSYTIVRAAVAMGTRVTIRNAAGHVVWDHKPNLLSPWTSLGWCGDLLRDGSRVLEVFVESGDIWVDARFLWLGSRAIDLLHWDQGLVPMVLAKSGPFALEGNDITLVAIWSGDPLDLAHGRDLIPVSETDPLPRVYGWRDLRYVDDTRHQAKIVRSWRAAQVNGLGPPSVPDPEEPSLAPGRCGSLLAIAIESLWLGDWNTIGPALGMNTPEKQALARLLPVAFERLGMVVGDDVPSDAYLVDPSTVPQ